MDARRQRTLNPVGKVTIVGSMIVASLEDTLIKSGFVQGFVQATPN